jgi:four helix bundle protein
MQRAVGKSSWQWVIGKWIKCIEMSFRDLKVYQKAFQLATDVFEMSKKFPKEETYSLTDQIRRSSRSVCSNLGESYRKRQYEKHFVSKISDADMENTETQVWLDFALACGYVENELMKNLNEKSEEVGRMLQHMIAYPEKYMPKSSRQLTGTKEQ